MTGSPGEELKWQMFEDMLLIRRFEEALVGLYRDKKFTSHYHLYIGQEATGVGAISCLAEKDYLATTHRNHGHVLARGADPGAAFAEILGKAGGLNRGFAGTIHVSDPERGFLSTSGIVGGAISNAVGAGLACKQRGEEAISAAFFGDGALEEGVAYEALNIAALWHLPVLFICENNTRGAMGMTKGGFPSLVHSASDLCDIPRTLGIETIKIDGSCVLETHQVVSYAVDRCRSGKGPVFVEAITPRWAGSSPLWPELATGITDLGMALGKVPTGGEHQEWFERYDPVLRLARTLSKAPGAPDRLGAVDRKVAKRIEEGIAFALASPPPDGADAMKLVFA